MNRFTLAAALCITLYSQSLPAADLIDGKARLQALETVTSLDTNGAKPWHLKMSFNLSDLKGKPFDQGTIELWWTTPRNEREVVTSPMYSDTARQAADPGAWDRERYLVNQLIREVEHPVTDYSHFPALLTRQDMRDFGKVHLSCLSVVSKTDPDPKQGTVPEFCTEPSSDVLRAHMDAAFFAVTRNRLAKFRDTYVALDNTLSYNRQIAIKGSVEILQRFAGDPASQDESPDSTPAHASSIPGVVLAGYIKKKAQPVYPDSAKRARITGAVLLHGIIAKDGTIQSLHVITSPDAALTESAMTAVRQWVYQPYLLNGQPTEVDSTFTVNYNLAGQ